MIADLLMQHAYILTTDRAGFGRWSNENLPLICWIARNCGQNTAGAAASPPKGGTRRRIGN
jgi:hypothetical protein